MCLGCAYARLVCWGVALMGELQGTVAPGESSQGRVKGPDSVGASRSPEKLAKRRHAGTLEAPVAGPGQGKFVKANNRIESDL